MHCNVQSFQVAITLYNKTEDMKQGKAQFKTIYLNKGNLKDYKHEDISLLDTMKIVNQQIPLFSKQQYQDLQDKLYQISRIEKSIIPISLIQMAYHQKILIKNKTNQKMFLNKEFLTSKRNGIQKCLIDDKFKNLKKYNLMKKNQSDKNFILYKNFNIGIFCCPVHKILYLLDIDSNSICILNEKPVNQGITLSWLHQWNEIEKSFKRTTQINDLKAKSILNLNHQCNDQNYKNSIKQDQYYYQKSTECKDYMIKPFKTLVTDLKILNEIEIDSGENQYNKMIGTRTIYLLDSFNIRSSVQTNQNTEQAAQNIFSVYTIDVFIKFTEHENDYMKLTVNLNMRVQDLIYQQFINKNHKETHEVRNTQIDDNRKSSQVNSNNLATTRRTVYDNSFGAINSYNDVQKYCLKAQDCNFQLIDNRPLIEQEYISNKIRFRFKKDNHDDKDKENEKEVIKNKGDIQLEIIENKIKQYEESTQSESRKAQFKGNIINLVEMNVIDAFKRASILIKNISFSGKQSFEILMYPMLFYKFNKDNDVNYDCKGVKFSQFHEKYQSQSKELDPRKGSKKVSNNITKTEEQLRIQIRQDQIDDPTQNIRIPFDDPKIIASSRKDNQFKNLNSLQISHMLKDKYNYFKLQSNPFSPCENLDRILQIKLNQISNIWLIFIMADIYRNSAFTDAESLCTHLPTIKKLKNSEEDQEPSKYEKFKNNFYNVFDKYFFKSKNINQNKLKEVNYETIRTSILQPIFQQTKVINEDGLFKDLHGLFKCDQETLCSIAENNVSSDKLQEFYRTLICLQMLIEPNNSQNQSLHKFRLNKVLKGMYNLPFEPQQVNINIELSNADQTIDSWSSKLYDFGFDIPMDDIYILNKFHLSSLPQETLISFSLTLQDGDQKNKQIMGASVWPLFDHQRNLNKGIQPYNFFPFSRTKNLIKCMREFNGIKLNKKIQDTFSLKQLCRSMQHINVNYDIQDSIMPFTSASNEIRDNLHLVENEPSLRYDQCLNDRFALWQAQGTDLFLYDELRDQKPSKKNNETEQSIMETSKSLRTVNLFKTISDSCANAYGNTVSLISALNTPMLTLQSKDNLQEYDYCKLHFEINEYTSIPQIEEDINDMTDFRYEQPLDFYNDPDQYQPTLQNLPLKGSYTNSNFEINHSDSESEEEMENDGSSTQTTVENDKGTDYYFQDTLQCQNILDFDKKQEDKKNKLEQIQNQFIDEKAEKQRDQLQNNTNVSEKMAASSVVDQPNIIDSFDNISESFTKIQTKTLLIPPTEFEMTTEVVKDLINVRFFVINETQMLPYQLMALERIKDTKTTHLNPKSLLRDEIKVALIKKIESHKTCDEITEWGYQTCVIGQMLADTSLRDWLVDNMLEQLDDFHLDLYLNFLITNLFQEQNHESSLANFLIRRAVRNQVFIGKQFYWKLKAYMHINFCRERIGIILRRQVMLTSVIKVNQQPEVHNPHNNEFTEDGQMSDYEKESRIVDKISKLSMWMVDNDHLEKSEKELQKNQELKALNELVKRQEGCNFKLPCKYQQNFIAVNNEKCRILSSKKKPIFLNLNHSGSEDPSFLIYKTGDDLRQDLIVLSFYQIIDQIAMKCGLDLKLNAYRVETTGQEEGFIEVVPNSKNFSEILSMKGAVNSSNDTLQNFFFELDKEGGATAEEKERINANNKYYNEIVSNFTKSCAGQCILTWIMGIADRHPSNMMIREDNGCFLHIDFGHFLGNFKSKFGIQRENSEFFQSPNFDKMMEGKNSIYEKQFHEICRKTLKLLRKNGSFIVYTLMNSVILGIPELSNKREIDWVEKRLKLDQDDQQSQDNFLKVMNEAKSDTIRKIDNFIHNLRHYG